MYNLPDHPVPALRRRRVRLPRVRRGALQLGDQVRVRLGLARLLRRAGQCQGHDEGRRFGRRVSCNENRGGSILLLGNDYSGSSLKSKRIASFQGVPVDNSCFGGIEPPLAKREEQRSHPQSLVKTALHIAQLLHFLMGSRTF